jgi:hypothetical protein
MDGDIREQRADGGTASDRRHSAGLKSAYKAKQVIRLT